MVPQPGRSGLATYIEILPVERSRTLAASNESDFRSVFRIQNGGFRWSALRTALRQ